MKNYLLYFAMFLLILCVPFRGNEEGVHWLWADITWVSTSLIFISLMCIGLYLYEQRSKERINEEKR
jgi:4-amino-4-deoxy-L-arabinose transferase-like glycosyltransferase